MIINNQRANDSLLFFCLKKNGYFWIKSLIPTPPVFNTFLTILFLTVGRISPSVIRQACGHALAYSGLLQSVNYADKAACGYDKALIPIPPVFDTFLTILFLTVGRISPSVIRQACGNALTDSRLFQSVNYADKVACGYDKALIPTPPVFTTFSI